MVLHNFDKCQHLQIWRREMNTRYVYCESESETFELAKVKTEEDYLVRIDKLLLRDHIIYG